MNWCGRADVELDVLEDRRDVAVAEVQRALRAQRVERARRHPLLDRDVEHVLARVARRARAGCRRGPAGGRAGGTRGRAGASSRREKSASPTSGSNGPGVVVPEVVTSRPSRSRSRRARRASSWACPAKRPLSIARIATSWPGTSARSAPTVHCSRGRCANGSKRYQRIAFSCVILSMSASGTS